EEAKEIAMQHNLQMNKYSIELQDPTAYKLIASSHDIFSNSTQNPTFYIYNFPQKGWVIVASDDIARPILAYSKEGSYSLENLPDAAKYWLEIYDSAISETIKQGAPQSEKIANEWLLARNPKKRTSLLSEVVPPLIKTNWGQDTPYNNLCPYDEKSKKRTLTGCVATTVAQIMKYWNFPANGRGKRIFTHEIYGKLYVDFENTTYDWENMANEYNQNSTEEQKRAVATLMYHCGVALSMNYGVKISSAYEKYIANSLKSYFMYDANARMISRSDYDDSTWTDMLKKNLDNNQPIAYSGSSCSICAAGHSFVCDGYDTDGRFHFNLGWEGIENGYYSIDALTNLNFNFRQNAIIDIKPNKEFNSQISLLKPLEIKQEVVYQNSTVKINANIVNNKSESFSGKISLRLFDTEDNFLMTIAEQEIDNLEVDKPTEIIFETNPLFNTSVGKYYVKLYHKHNILNQWLLSSGHNKLVLDVQKPLNTESKLSLYSLPILSSYKIDKYKIDNEKDSTFKATASFINTSETDFKGIISASIYDEKGTIIKELASYNVTEAIAPNGHIKDIEFSNTILDLAHGIYFIGFMSKDESEEFALVNTNNFISFIKFEILAPDLITNSQLKKWIKSNTDQLPGVFINEDGGITKNITNLEALSKIENLECRYFNLVSIDELISNMQGLKTLLCYNSSLIDLDISNNIKLEKLVCSNNQLTNLDVSKNTELKELDCNKNQLTDLDVKNNLKLEKLVCYNNQLTNLDVSKNTELKELDCNKNQLTDLDVKNNLKLIKLACSDNQLTNLDVSKNIELMYLKCAYNPLNNLDISNNIKLEALHCFNNQLTNLDVTSNINLIELGCFDNQLTSLDVSKNINIESLHCYKNQLNNLDVSKNIKLYRLDCFDNQLVSLDVSKNINIEMLVCNNNQLTSLDLSKNIKLTFLFCNDNMLASLDVSPLTNLWILNCCNQAEGFILYLTDAQKGIFTEENYCDAILAVAPTELITAPQLKVWIKSNTDKLPKVVVNEDGGITGTTTNLEALAKIENLECNNSSSLVSIDELIRHMPNLKTLICSFNSLIELDVSNNIKLESLHCNNNQLTNLNISSPTNLLVLNCCNQAEGFILHLTNEQKSKFSEEDYCDAILYTELITNSKLKEWIKSNKNKLSGVVVNENGGIDSTTTNLEALAKIENLECINSSTLVSIDELIRHMPNLKTLVCYRNSLIELDLSNNIELEELDCSNNRLNNLDVTNNVKLIKLACSDNQLSNLDLSNNIELTYLKCNHNTLNNLDIINNIKLEALHCFKNQLTSLDVTSNVKLIELGCFDNQLSNLDLSKNINIEALYCYNNQLNNLDIINSIKLKQLYCSDNQLSNLNVSKNTRLKALYCEHNILNSLDIGPLLNLVELKCCYQAEGFILYLTNKQKNKFSKKAYCDAILKENGSICEIEWLDIYPNPTSGKFFIDSKFISDEIKILNLTGEVLYSKILNSETTEIDISNLPAGVYIVITKGKIGKVVKK
ncbi:MAG: T9SS type A sorting domain-containing protein, partial [Ignavibacteria bacterium]|nr:T9SS type A sorting domain-containing protein [Ignavibacteria bacterium]